MSKVSFGFADAIDLDVPVGTRVRDLSAREREVLVRVAMGHSNKLIADSLGIAPPTVATHLARARRKLGVENERLVLQALGTPTPNDWPRRALTPAERAVAVLASEGHSNRSIAERRHCSVHTVAKQLSSAYAKLGTGTRRTLSSCIGQSSCDVIVCDQKDHCRNE